MPNCRCTGNMMLCVQYTVIIWWSCSRSEVTTHEQELPRGLTQPSQKLTVSTQWGKLTHWMHQVTLSIYVSESYSSFNEMWYWDSYAWYKFIHLEIHLEWTMCKGHRHFKPFWGFAVLLGKLSKTCHTPKCCGLDQNSVLMKFHYQSHPSPQMQVTGFIVGWWRGQRKKHLWLQTIHTGVLFSNKQVQRPLGS